MAKSKVVVAITCIDGDRPEQRRELAEWLRGQLAEADRRGYLFNTMEAKMVDIATSVYVEVDSVDELLYDILTGDGAQAENMDELLMQETVDRQMQLKDDEGNPVADEDNIPFSISKDTLFRLIRAVNDRREE